MSVDWLLGAYDWRAGLALLAMVVVLTKLGHFLAFQVPAFQRMRELNRAEDKIRLAKEKYRPMIKRGMRVGMLTNVVFFLVLAPFVSTLETAPLWRALLDIVVILMIYDFFYYLMHRFLLHAAVDSRFAVLSYFRRVHAVHHQARDPSHIDAYYVHPLETFAGLALFLVTIYAFGLAVGDVSFLTVAVTYVVFTQLNVINHTRIDLPDKPYKPLNWITRKHHVHHIDMQQGNYATITLLYDKLFGTLD